MPKLRWQDSLPELFDMLRAAGLPLRREVVEHRRPMWTRIMLLSGPTEVQLLGPGWVAERDLHSGWTLLQLDRITSAVLVKGERPATFLGRSRETRPVGLTVVDADGGAITFELRAGAMHPSVLEALDEAVVRGAAIDEDAVRLLRSA